MKNTEGNAKRQGGEYSVAKVEPSPENRQIIGSEKHSDSSNRRKSA